MEKKLPLYTAGWKSEAETLGLSASVELIYETRIREGIEKKTGYSRFVLTITNGEQKIVTVQRHSTGAYKSEAFFYNCLNGSQEKILVGKVSDYIKRLAVKVGA